MSYRLLVALVVFFSYMFGVPAKQPAVAMERHVNTISYEALSEMSTLNGQILDSSATEELIGRVVPSEGITSKGMLVEETPQTAAHFIRTMFAPGLLIILLSMIYLRKHILG